MTQKSTPITPEDAAASFASNIPNFVIDSVNQMISKKFSGVESFSINQRELMDLVEKNWNFEEAGGREFSRQIVYNNKWFDFEPLFRKFDWKVGYDRPAYNETGEAYWTFSAKWG